MIKAVFLDIDGTLIRFDTHEIPDSALKVLHQAKEKGIRLFIASGRPPIQMSLLCESFRTFPWDGKVLLNGQYCLDEKEQVMHQEPLPMSAMEKLVPWLMDKQFNCAFYELDYAYDIHFNQDYYNYLKEIGHPERMLPVEDVHRALSHETFQICPYIPADEDAEFLRHAPGCRSARWTPDFADIIPEDGGKPEGVKRMLAKYGIAREECMAFGDGANDITMLQYAGIGVAMGNANDDVKAAADYVTAPIDQDGLAKAFVHFHLATE